MSFVFDQSRFVEKNYSDVYEDGKVGLKLILKRTLRIQFQPSYTIIVLIFNVEGFKFRQDFLFSFAINFFYIVFRS